MDKSSSSPTAKRAPWFKRWRIFAPPTATCRLCFNTFTPSGLRGLFSSSSTLCEQCFAKLHPRFRAFKTAGVPGLALYDYDEDIRHLIYQLKGCKDVALAPIFLDPFRLALRIMFWGYTMVPAPSWHEDDAERGFNHVEEIFRSLGLKTVKILRKTSPLKQADLHQTERAQVHTRIALDKSVIKIPRKVLFVDDVLTTGSTARAACDLLRETGVHKIRILVIAKTLNNEEKQRASSAVAGIARK